MILVLSLIDVLVGIIFGSISFIGIGILTISSSISILIDKSIGNLKTYCKEEQTSFEIFKILLISILLLSSAFIIIYNSIVRILEPVFVESAVYIIYLLVELSIYIFLCKGNIKEKDNFINIIKYVSLFVVFILIFITKNYIIDSIVALVISIILIIVSYREVCKISSYILDSIHLDIDESNIREELLNIEGVKEISVVHLWKEKGEYYISLKVKGSNKTKIQNLINESLNEKGIKNTIIEIEK